MTVPFTPSGVLTLTTDFGHQGPFVGVMKGRILERFPAARIVDLTHDIVVHWPAEAGSGSAAPLPTFPPVPSMWPWWIRGSAPRGTSCS